MFFSSTETRGHQKLEQKPPSSFLQTVFKVCETSRGEKLWNTKDVNEQV